MNDAQRVKALSWLLFKAEYGELDDSMPEESRDFLADILNDQLEPLVGEESAEPEIEDDPVIDLEPVQTPEPKPVTPTPGPRVEVISSFILPYNGRIFGNPQDGLTLLNTRIANHQALRFLCDFEGVPTAYHPFNRTLNQPNINDRGKKGLDYYKDCYKHGLGPDRCGFIIPSCYHVGNGGVHRIAIVEDDGTPEHKPSDIIVAEALQLYMPTDYRDVPFPEIVFNPETAQALKAGELYHFVHINQTPAPVVGRMSIEDAKKADINKGAQGLDGSSIQHIEVGDAGYGDIGRVHFKHLEHHEWREGELAALPWWQLVLDHERRIGNSQWSYFSIPGKPPVKVIHGDVVGRQRFTVLQATRRVVTINLAYGHTANANGKPLTLSVVHLSTGKVVSSVKIPFSQKAKDFNKLQGFWKKNQRVRARVSLGDTKALQLGEEYVIEARAPAGAGFIIATSNNPTSFKDQHGKFQFDRDAWLESTAEISDNGGRDWGPWAGESDKYKKHRFMPVYFNIEGMPLDLNMDTLDEYRKVLRANSKSAAPVEKHAALPTLEVSERRGNDIRVKFGFGENRFGRLKDENLKTGKIQYTPEDTTGKWGGPGKEHQQWIRNVVDGTRRVTAQTSDDRRNWYDVGNPIDVSAAGEYTPDLQTTGDLRTALKRGFVYANANNVKTGDGKLLHTFMPSDKGSIREQGSAKIESGHAEYRVTQTLFFPKDFNPMRGGKCGFGLFGGISGDKSAGHVINPARWSLRNMFRPPRDESLIGTHLALVNYSYNANRDLSDGKTWGDDHFIADIPLGEDVVATMIVGLNKSADKSDGFMAAEINGKELMRDDGIQWQAEGTPGEGMELEYTGHYGGNDKTWAPPEIQRMQISHVVASWR